MKRILFTVGLSVFMVGCSNEEAAPVEEPQEQTEAPVEVVEEQETVDPNSFEATGTVEEDGYIKYRGAEWTGGHEGANLSVGSVSVTQDLSIPYPDFTADLKDMPGLLMWIRLENEADANRQYDFSQAAIVMPDGQEIEADPVLSEFILEDMRPGTNKEGNLAFVLDPDELVADIDSITFYFSVSDEAGNMTEVQAPLQLK